MKPLYLIFTFIFCHTLISFGQNIHVKIASSDIENHDIQMILPVGGSPFYASKMDTVLNKDYKLDLTFNDPEGGLYTLVFANTRYNLFLSPGDRLHIAFSKNEEGKVVPDFEGDNADGHLMYTKFYRPYYQGLAAGYMQEYKTNDKSRDAIFAWMNKDLSMLDSLYGIKKITEDYRELAKASTETYCL